jgi:hypothetical protein
MTLPRRSAALSGCVLSHSRAPSSDSWIAHNTGFDAACAALLKAMTDPPAKDARPAADTTAAVTHRSRRVTAKRAAAELARTLRRMGDNMVILHG